MRDESTARPVHSSSVMLHPSSPVASRPGLAAGLPFSGAEESLQWSYRRRVKARSLREMREMGEGARIARKDAKAQRRTQRLWNHRLHRLTQIEHRPNL